MRDVGDRINIRHEVRDAAGTLTNATVSVAVTKPDGTTVSPAPTVTNPSTGIYDAAFTVDAAGKWRWTWDVSGAVVDKAYGQVDVADPAPPVYASLAILKLQLGITASDATRDELLNQKLLSASRGIEGHCGGRRFYADATATARTYRVRDNVVPDPDGELLYVDDISTTSGLIVETRNGSGTSVSWTAVTDYLTDPDNAITKGEAITGLRRDRRCWNTDRIRVTAKWGWPVIPEVVVEACLLQAGRLYKRKDSPEGVAGSAEWGVVRVARIDPDVQDMLTKLVLPAVG